MDIALHYSAAQPHQREHYEWFAEGFKRHGLTLRGTHDPREDADIHIITGPHFALHYWIGHPRTLFLNRAYWHNKRPKRWQSMDYVSLGWLRPDGGRNFIVGQDDRERPIIRDRPKATATLFLADFDGPIEQADTVRLHPERRRYSESLESVLSRHGVAIGYTTTALVTAALAGLEIICKDKRNILAEPNWLNKLAYADWNADEIMSGEAIAHLWSSL